MIISFSIFTFIEGNEDKVQKGIEEHLSLIKNQKGHLKSFSARALDNPHKHLIYSEWDNKENYEATGERLRLAKESDLGFEEFFDLMSEEPILGSFEVED